MTSALHLLVRLAHVFGMAILLGGAVFAWRTLRADGREAFPVLVRFEWLFWGMMGLTVATGVGNLGVLGPPGPSTRWGAVLTVKLLAVFLLAILSIVRSFAVLRFRERGAPPERRARGHLRILYSGTVWGLGLIVALAEVLAHG